MQSHAPCRYSHGRGIGVPPVECGIGVPPVIRLDTPPRDLEQTLTGKRTPPIFLLLLLLFTTQATAQTLDHFDGGQARWQVGVQNCEAQRINSSIDLQGGRHGTPAEVCMFAANSGSIAELLYPLQPSAVSDAFQMRLWVRAPRGCGPLGVRIRFPNLIDPRTNQPAAAIVSGDSYTQAGQWQELKVGDLPRQLRLKQIALRGQFGSQVNLNDPFIDGVVFNAYQAPGVNQLWFEDLEILGQLPYATTGSPPLESGTTSTTVAMNQLVSPKLPQATAPSYAPNDVFAAGKLLCILQYNGEPMDWLRALGIDVVCMDRPPSVEQLISAHEVGMKVICPAPPYVRNDLNGRLDPVIGWQVGDAVDLTDLPVVAQRAEQVRSLPADWQRPLVMTVLEGWREASIVGDVFVREFPPALRNLSVKESLAAVEQSQAAMGRQRPWCIGVDLGAPTKLVKQWEAIGGPIGAPVSSSVMWHDLWLKTAGALTLSPRGILFRSNQGLDSGQPSDQQKATALRMLCQWLHAIEPVAAGSTLGPSLEGSLQDYQVHVLNRPDATLLLMISQGGQAGAPRAGDGRVLQMRLPQSLRGAIAYRLASPIPDRLNLISHGIDDELSIVSPDLVEAVLLVKQPEQASEFLKRWQKLARTVTADRWQLVYEDLMATRNNWQTFASVFPSGTAPMPLLVAAANALQESQVAFQSNQWSHATSLLRRADAWQLRAHESLLSRIRPPEGIDASLPTLLAPGSVHLHLTWPPALGGGRWQPVEIRGTDFKDINLLQATGWTHDRRQEDRTEVELGLSNADGTAGTGNLRMAAWPKPNQVLRGGYEGTTLRVRSPQITGIGGGWVRVEAHVRTPLGFGGPEEGLLIYETIGGAELGKLIRGDGKTHVVHLYRLVPEDQGLQVCFELLGPGEAYLERLSVDSWRAGTPPVSFQPLASDTP